MLTLTVCGPQPGLLRVLVPAHSQLCIPPSRLSSPHLGVPEVAHVFDSNSKWFQKVLSMQAYDGTTYLADWLLCLLLQRVMCVIACEKSLKLDIVRPHLFITTLE